VTCPNNTTCTGAITPVTIQAFHAVEVCQTETTNTSYAFTLRGSMPQLPAYSNYVTNTDLASMATLVGPYVIMMCANRYAASGLDTHSTAYATNERYAAEPVFTVQ